MASPSSFLPPIVIPLLKLSVIIVDLCFDFSASQKVSFEYFMASSAEEKVQWLHLETGRILCLKLNQEWLFLCGFWGQLIEEAIFDSVEINPVCKRPCPDGCWVFVSAEPSQNSPPSQPHQHTHREHLPFLIPSTP